MKYWTLISGELTKVSVVNTDNGVLHPLTKQISYYDNGNEVRNFRVLRELFTNKKQAIKYFKS